MNTEFHYYVTGMIAHAAGFSKEEAKTIATASEFVDENDSAFTIEDRAGGTPYECYISQTMNILKPKRDLMRIYPLFHFLPGEPDCVSACRRDGKMHILNTTPANEMADTLIESAFKAADEIMLYQVGIASHAYADTWAHQNFVGWHDYFNNIGFDPKPDIGHADAEHHPDWIAHRWDDVRLVEGEVNNGERFLTAAEHLYKKYRSFCAAKKQKAHTSWHVLENEFVHIFGPSRSGSADYGRDQRMTAYREKAPWLGDFNEDEWLEKAIETHVKGMSDLKKGFFPTFSVLKDRFFWRNDVEKEKTDWFRFQEAVKAHQREAMTIIKPRFDRMCIDLHQY